MNIREIKEVDAAAFLVLQKQIDKETSYMLYEPGERTMTISEQQKMLQTIHKASNSAMLGAESMRKLVAYIGVLGSPLKRKRHVGQIVIGVVAAYHGQGIGRRLLQEAEIFAKQAGLLRLELTVMKHNKRALALYKSVGYQIEGEKTCSLRIDGNCVDEWTMAKILSF
ncbi:GNAT family N-acetyltransferase [Bacillus sp. FSL W7-1360]